MNRLISYKQLREHGVPLCRRQVDRLESEGRFPTRVQFSANRVMWVATEIEAYVEEKIAARSKRRPR